MNRIILLLVIIFLGSCGNRQGNVKMKSEKKEPSVNINPVPTDTIPATVKDIDGNVYNTIKIGEQTWMKENLKTTKFNDGMPISLVSDGSAWAKSITPSYCWYNNDSGSFKDLYGALYNGYAASSGKLCPKNWHVPGDAEWNTLAGYLGGDKVAGGKLKVPGFNYWVTPNTAADNTAGFSALPGGLRYYDGVFHDLGFGSYFWTQEESSPGRSWFRYMDYEYSDLFRFNNSAKIGFSIRCIRD